MAQKLKLEVVLQALDRATKPIRAITQGSVGLGRELKTTRDQLKQLQAQQRDVRSYRVAAVAAAQQTRAIRDLATKSRGYSQALEQQRTVHQNLRGNLKSAQTQYNKLARALIDGKGNTAEFQRELEKANIRLTSARQAFERSSGSIKQYQTRLRNADHKLDELNRSHKASQDQLTAVKQRLEQAGISTHKLGNQERALRQRIDGTNTQLQEQERRLKAVTAQQQRLARAKQQYQRTQAMAGSMAGTGAAGLATGSGMIYTGARLLAPGIEFDSGISRVQALARLNANSPELAALRAQARELGANTQFTANDAAQGQGFLAMAGFSPEAIQAAMPAMLDVAKAGAMDLASTADVASNILTGFNLEAAEMARVGDVLTAAFTRSNTSLEMLGETMKYAAPNAAAYGQDIETMAAAAGKLGDAGIQGSMAGTAMRAILSRLAAPPKMAADAIAELGIQVADAEGNMRPLPDLLKEIHDRTAAMGDTQRGRLLKAIAGEEAGSALTVLTQQAGSGALQELIAQLRVAQGEASATAKVMADNLGGDLESLKSVWADLGIQMQDTANKDLRGMVQGIAEVVRGIKAWMVENPELTGAIIKTAAGMALLITLFGGITLALASVLGPFAMIRYGLVLFTGKSLALLPVIKSVGTAFLWLGRMLMANPIGIAIGLLVAAGWLLYKNWDGVVGGLKAIWQNLSEVGQRVWAEVKEAFNGGILGVGQLIANWSPLGLFYKAFAAVMSWFGVDLPSKFTDFGAMLMQGLVNGIKNSLGAVKGAITSAGDSTVSWFKDKLGIHSPSRVFAELGGFTMQGLAQGIQRQQSEPLAAVAGVSQRLANAADGIRFDSRRPLSARPAYAGNTGSQYEIHIHTTPGMSPQAIAHAVAAELDRRERAASARRRSSLYDQE
ncbi:phage tail tape measure protein [Halopseudomonas oceani]|uniref:phage tail tape measure protein n=1 Tax=Halopseudomonas oceani TaxID=1708783 RepID=UPI002AA7D24F|nr:phage tail tape measure protein [Halopseudomonas oceani]